ncbi:hypothetical protein [Reyranella sp.]|uniref:hypothetical protein n=1 Tax=Reyranella sp. TaxID=1929291 RepID=UPI00272F59F5|nr:hypothetical protein [Reyranella sp.]MDP2378711.1 hypothetical protein [Reyranella sp.]
MKYFEAFGEGGYHSAFMTTYAFGTLAFEDVPFPKLRGAGCRNITVLADRQMVNQVFAEFGLPRFAGSSYHLIKADAPGAFHPKITVLIGATKGRLMVGSANLTALGLGGNKELVANILYTPDLPDHAKFFADALAYIRRYVPPDDPWFTTSLQRAVRRAPWLQVGASTSVFDNTGMADLALLYDRPEVNILGQIVASIGNDVIERLVVVSPYWDMKLEGLARLRAALGNPLTDLLIENDANGFPASELKRFSDIDLFDIGGATDGRFVHAKLIVALGQTWDHVISGSMNCTFPALMGPSTPGGNAEAGIYKRVPSGIALLTLGLDNYRDTPLPVSAVAEIAMAQRTTTERESYVDGGTLMLQSSRLSWIPVPQSAQQAAKLQLFDRNGLAVGEAIDLAKSADRTWQLASADTRPKYGEITFDDGVTSAPIQVIDLDFLAVTTLPPQRGRQKHLIDSLTETLHEDLVLIETLNQLEALEFEERHAVGDKPAQANTPAPNTKEAHEYGVLPYDEFVRARTTAHPQGSLARGFLNGRQDSAASLVGACLNKLIGLVSPDLNDVEDRDFQSLNAIDFTTTEPQASLDGERTSDAFEVGQRPRNKSEQTLATAKKFQEAVSAFEERCKSLRGKSISTSELVRLRALIQIILSHSQAVQGDSLPTQILPVYNSGGYDWPRLIGRLLLQHFGASRALQKLRVEQDEGEQRRVIEYLALASWAANAARFAVNVHPHAIQLRKPLGDLVATLKAQVQLILSTVPEDKIYFDDIQQKLDQRFRSRLGLNANGNA